MGVEGWPDVFRGSAAVAAGLVTPGALRGPNFVRIFPDIYAPVGDAPPDLALRSLAAALLVGGRGVVSGYSAAELLDASCGPAGAPAEVTLLRGRQRSHPGRGRSGGGGPCTRSVTSRTASSPRSPAHSRA